MAVVIIWIICACIGLAIGQQKGRATEGFILGLVLGLIGVLIIVIMKPAAGFQTAQIPQIAPNYVPATTALPQAQPSVSAAQLSSTGSVTDALRELEQLRQDGVLSDAEFAATKKKLLGI